jgi:hypothetical protein
MIIGGTGRLVRQCEKTLTRRRRDAEEKKKENKSGGTESMAFEELENCRLG